MLNLNRRVLLNFLTKKAMRFLKMTSLGEYDTEQYLLSEKCKGLVLFLIREVRYSTGTVRPDFSFYSVDHNVDADTTYFSYSASTRIFATKRVKRQNNAGSQDYTFYLYIFEGEESDPTLITLIE